MDDRVVCRTPNPDAKPVRIDGWKFKVMRDAILDVLPAEGDGLPFKELPFLVDERLDHETQERLGSLMWYLTTVKLELEVRGEVARVEKRGPQRLLRVDP